MSAKKIYRIGLTGGIASGKSKLLGYLATIPRIYTINLDLIGHQIYQLNPIVLRNLSTLLGPDSLSPSSTSGLPSLNRERVGQLVFQNEYNLRVLRSLVSPEIKRLLSETIKEVELNKAKDIDVIAVEGAVLIEARTYPMFDELWVTTLAKDLALERVLTRNPNLTEA